MAKLTALNVEEIFKWEEPEPPRQRLVAQVSKDSLALAQSILYNVPDSPERMMALKRLHDLTSDCVNLILEG